MSAAAVSPIVPLVKMYTGTPIAAAVPKHISWRAVRLNIALFLILLRSFGTLTNAIGHHLASCLFVRFADVQFAAVRLGFRLWAADLSALSLRRMVSEDRF